MSVMRIKDAQGNWQEVAALHGLPGTSVSITSISESTEDDGYSVVTFSDGKTLRVKNGSKGSAGEGGAGGGVVTVYCQPSDDMQSFTASMTVEEIRTAFEEHKAVQAIVLGMGIVAHAFMVTEDVVLFSSVASFAGESMAVTLNMMADGTNAMIVAPLGGMVVANITTEDGETYTTDKTAAELYAAVSAGMPVYASLMGMYIPAQNISDGEAVFRVVFSDGTVTVRISTSAYAEVEVAPAGGGGDSVIVQVTETMNGAYEADMTADAIYTIHTAGARVVCHVVPSAGIEMFLSPIVVTEVSTLFAGIFDAQGQYMKSVSVTVTNDPTAIVTETPLDKVPNPKPLTINGTSYDGSEAVTINVEGGGGGGDEGVYELIEKYTSAEEAAFVRTQEPDGTPYRFKALFVKFEVTGPVQTNLLVAMEALGDGKKLGDFFQTITGDPYKLRDYTAFEVIQDKGYWRSMTFAATTVSDSYPSAKYSGTMYTLTTSIENYPYITKFASSNYYPLPAGVKMEIWGVRA